MTSQQQIKYFKEVSGCTDSNEAHGYLEACNGNLEQAINLYFSNKSRSKQKVVENFSQPTTSKQSTSRRNDARLALNDKISLVNLSDDDDDFSSRGNKDFYRNDDHVRAPIAPVQGPIVEQSFRQTYGSRKGSSNPIFEQYYDFRQIAEQQDAQLRQKLALNGSEISHCRSDAKSFCKKKNAVNSQIGAAESSFSYNLRSNQLKNASEKGKSAKDLKTLFRPPVEITFKEDWDSALIEARRCSTWLLVNVQMAAEFSCQILNRDIWSESTVREIIQSNFLFWQVYHDSPDGVRVCNYYDIQFFPAIFIVDPRTGEKVVKFRAQDPVSFLDQVTAFLEQFPSFAARDEKISGCKCIAYSDPKNASENSVGKRRRQKYVGDVAMDDADEDFESSASTQAKRMKRVVNLNDDNVEDDFANSMVTDDCESSSRQNGYDDFVANIPPTVNAWKDFINKNDSVSPSVQLLLRFADGDKQTIVAPNSTTLEMIFVFMAGRKINANEYQLVLNFPKRVFTIGDREKSFADVGFGGQEVIHIEKI